MSASQISPEQLSVQFIVEKFPQSLEKNFKVNNATQRNKLTNVGPENMAPKTFKN